MPRVLITGCRSWACDKLAERIVGRLIARYGLDDLVLIHGACPTGVDESFDLAAAHAGINVARYPADWSRHGDRAGPMRNQEMVDSRPDFAIAVHRTLASSRGTRDCVNKCLADKIPVYLIDSVNAEPRRVTAVEGSRRSR